MHEEVKFVHKKQMRELGNPPKDNKVIETHNTAFPTNCSVPLKRLINSMMSEQFLDVECSYGNKSIQGGALRLDGYNDIFTELISILM
ncbi:unnamed protein product, partial [Sphenostylis stenocarpa]